MQWQHMSEGNGDFTDSFRRRVPHLSGVRCCMSTAMKWKAVGVDLTQGFIQAELPKDGKDISKLCFCKNNKRRIIIIFPRLQGMSRIRNVKDSKNLCIGQYDKFFEEYCLLPILQLSRYWLSPILSQYLIYLLRSCSCVAAAASLSPQTFFSVDTCPHEYLKHLLFHPLAHVIECASGEAEEAIS